MPFPIELVECIIDASCLHPPTLAACSLVCKQWLPRSRHHLFGSLDLSADWTPEPNVVTNFFNIIDTPNSTLTPYITGVVLSKRCWGMTPVHRILTVLARSGIRPGFLHINCPAYEPVHFPIFSSSLAHLALYLHTDIPMSTLIDHVCGFPLLESLYISGSARYSTLLRPRSREPPRKLKTLMITNPVFTDWLLSLDPVPTQISTVVLRDIRMPHQWSAINKYITSAAGPAIRSISFQSCEPLHQYIFLNFNRIDTLQELLVETSSPAGFLSVLGAVHGAVLCTTLETIELCTSNDLTDWPEGLHAVDAMLADVMAFPSLRRVAIRIRARKLENPDFPIDYQIPAALVTQLHQAMARCHDRGLVFTP
ncbi:hypothetical protein B0H19DRAFT_1382699 [Mycena capillaripes]|nr:hypothetical protein B0H19DRAFT_1382699 [Mycena capillaripes]